MSDVPPTRPFLQCECGFSTPFLSGLRRHQYGIHDGLVGHHTQLPRRRQYGGLTEDSSPGGDERRVAGHFVGDDANGAARGAVRGGVHAHNMDGNMADDESDASSVPPSPPAQPDSSESGSTAHSAVESQLRTLLELTRILVPPGDGGGAAADAVPEYLYSSMGLHVRALYEALGDARRAEPLVHRRKRAKTGRFDTVRLRALQRFVLRVGGAGLSEKDQEFLYEFLDCWDGIKAGMAQDAGHHKTLRH